MNHRYKFGSFSSESLCKIFFLLGSILAIIPSYAFGAFIASVTTYERNIQYQDGWFTSETVPNALLGVILGAVLLAILIFLWRCACEVLYIIINYFKTNTK